MKKLLILFTILLTVKTTIAQKNFEGEIDYRMYGLSEGQKDTTIGNSYKIIFGKHAINVQSFTQKGILWEEQIMLLDSAKQYVIDHRDKTYILAWKYDPDKRPVRRLPWGMDKIAVNPAIKKIVGYDVFDNFLTTEGHPEYGHVDLYEAKPLYFKLPPHIAIGSFFESMLFYDDHIMLAMRVISGKAPYGQINRVATKVEARRVDDSIFKIPADYTLRN
ncbi:MAG: hypothetical protein M3O71_32150 [Bacteroidota bacterium]|nr:hypothetical protein [Bacteroidota bacterium]